MSAAFLLKDVDDSLHKVSPHRHKTKPNPPPVSYSSHPSIDLYLRSLFAQPLLTTAIIKNFSLTDFERVIRKYVI